ncbi:MAG: SDR family oxidoreductase [Leptolyngbyaceae cyanobacterium MO_188.B28]|nr:SDR family oxidoreductase [Leptolyngbyaceae cyanobacterium MO_188.B28]
MQSSLSESDHVLVAGATGGVGQLAVAKLRSKGIRVRILTRSAEKARKLFQDQVEAIIGDTLDPTSLQTAVQNITHILCCTGTTAFPSARWDFNRTQGPLDWLKLYLNPKDCSAKANNSPEQVDANGVKNLVAAAPSDLKRFVFISSCGVLRKESLPYSLLNAFGVLDAKQKGEEAVVSSGLPYTVLRPGRLIDGPYTSFDLNTLLKAKTDGKLGIVVDTGDTLSGETSRIDLAAACVECLSHPNTEGKVFELVNKGPRPEAIDWEGIFSRLE